MFDNELKECPEMLLSLHRDQLWAEELGRHHYHNPDDTEHFQSCMDEMIDYANQKKLEYTKDTLFYQTKLIYRLEDASSDDHPELF